MKKLDPVEPYDEQVTRINLKKGTRDRITKLFPFDSTWDRSFRQALDHLEKCNRYEGNKLD